MSKNGPTGSYLSDQLLGTETVEGIVRVNRCGLVGVGILFFVTQCVSLGGGLAFSKAYARLSLFSCYLQIRMEY